MMRMKKNMLIIASMSTVFLQGMENSKSIDYTFELTLVRLTQGSIYDIADGNVKFIVVSKNEQDKLQQKSTFYDANMIGNTGFVPKHTVYIRNKNVDSSAGDDRDNPQKIVETIETRKLKSRLISVIEPWPNRNYIHTETRSLESYFDKNRMHDKELLPLCYTNVLGDAALKRSKQKQQKKLHKKSIAIPLSLGKDLLSLNAEDRVFAVEKAIFGFIMKYGDYKLVHLFVETEFDFALYKALLDKRSSDL